jgi:hypothetical protein
MEDIMSNNPDSGFQYSQINCCPVALDITSNTSGGQSDSTSGGLGFSGFGLSIRGGMRGPEPQAKQMLSTSAFPLDNDYQMAFAQMVVGGCLPVTDGTAPVPQFKGNQLQGGNILARDGSSVPPAVPPTTMG